MLQASASASHLILVAEIVPHRIPVFEHAWYPSGVGWVVCRGKKKFHHTLGKDLVAFSSEVVLPLPPMPEWWRQEGWEGFKASIDSREEPVSRE